MGTAYCAHLFLVIIIESINCTPLVKRIGIIAFFSLLSVLAIAGNTVLVKVYDKGNRTALPGAKVEFVKTTNQQESGFTNNLGCAHFGISLGTYKLTISADGFKNFSDYMTIENEGDAIFVFLEPGARKPQSNQVKINVSQNASNVTVDVKETQPVVTNPFESKGPILDPTLDVKETPTPVAQRFVPEEPTAAEKNPAVRNLSPLNLVVLADKSTSMNDNGKMGLLKETLLDMTTKLKSGDKFTLIVCDTKSRVLFQGASAEDFEVMITEITKLKGDGFTKVSGSVKQAFDLCISESEYNTRNKVVFLTDGAIDTKDLSEQVKKTADYGIRLELGAIKPLPKAERSLKDVMKEFDGDFSTLTDPKSVKKLIDSSMK